ncbi:MAG: hypothetical protein WCF85_06860 [Rhodospirillaceae bacterium]
MTNHQRPSDHPVDSAHEPPTGGVAPLTGRSSAPDAAMLDIVSVRLGAERLALLLTGIQSLATLEAVETVTTLGGGRHRLAQVNGRLLPAVFLSERFGGEPVAGPFAVVGGPSGNEVALLLPADARFDRMAVGALDRIPGLPGAVLWWRHGADEPPVGVYDFATLAGTPAVVPAPDLPYCSLPAADHAVTDPPASDMIRLTCRGVVFALPLALVDNALCPGETPPLERVPGRHRPGRIPVLDGRRLLTGHTGDKPGLRVRLVPPAGPVMVLVVDKAELMPFDPDRTWLAPPLLPAMSRALIDAVAWDARNGVWIYRLHPGITFGALPITAKKAVVAALIGCLPSLTEQTSSLPAWRLHD